MTISHMSADAQAFTVTNTITAHEGDDRVYHRTTDAVIPRRGV